MKNKPVSYQTLGLGGYTLQQSGYSDLERVCRRVCDDTIFVEGTWVAP